MDLYLSFSGASDSDPNPVPFCDWEQWEALKDWAEGLPEWASDLKGFMAGMACSDTMELSAAIEVASADAPEALAGLVERLAEAIGPGDEDETVTVVDAFGDPVDDDVEPVAD